MNCSRLFSTERNFVIGAWIHTSPKFNSGGPEEEGEEEVRSFVSERAWKMPALLDKQIYRRRLWIIDWEREVSHIQSFLFVLWEPCSALLSMVYPTMIFLLRQVQRWLANDNSNWDTLELEGRESREWHSKDTFSSEGMKTNRDLLFSSLFSRSFFLLDGSDWHVDDVLDSHQQLHFNLGNQIIFKYHPPCWHVTAEQKLRIRRLRVLVVGAADHLAKHVALCKAEDHFFVERVQENTDFFSSVREKIRSGCTPKIPLKGEICFLNYRILSSGLNGRRNFISASLTTVKTTERMETLSSARCSSSSNDLRRAPRHQRSAVWRSFANKYDVLIALFTFFSTSARGTVGEWSPFPGLIPMSTWLSNFRCSLEEISQAHDDFQRPIALFTWFVSLRIVGTVAHRTTDCRCSRELQSACVPHLCKRSPDRRSCSVLREWTACCNAEEECVRRIEETVLILHETVFPIEWTDTSRTIVGKGNFVLLEIVRIGIGRSFHVRGVIRTVQSRCSRMKASQWILSGADVNSHFIGNQWFESCKCSIRWRTVRCEEILHLPMLNFSGGISVIIAAWPDKVHCVWWMGCDWE